MRRAALWAMVFYTAVTLTLTYPLIRHLADGVPGDLGDPVLNTWILWWNSRTVPLTSAWWNAPAFFPSSDVLALSEHLLGLSAFTTPVIWLTGHPLFAYNLVFLGTFVLSGLGGYALGFTLTGRRAAGFVSGAAFAFAPYRMAQLSHVQVLAAFWMPFALVGLHRYARTGAVRWLALFALATLGQGLSNGYFLLFFPVLVGLWLVWFPPQGRRLMTVAAVGAAYAIASLPLVPVLLRYHAVHGRLGLRRSLDEMSLFSADITDLWHAAPQLSFWSRWLPAAGPEREVFPGLTVVALVLAAALLGRRGGPEGPGPAPETHPPAEPRHPLAFYAGAAVVMWALCLGPSPSFGGRTVLDSDLAPYRWLAALPGFGGLRVPARFATIATLCLAAAAGVAVARLQRRFTRRGQAVLLAAACAGVLVEGWRRTPIEQPPLPPIVTSADPSGAVLELPYGSPIGDLAAMYRGMTHRRPVVNGYSGNFPPQPAILLDAMHAGDEDVLRVLAARGLRHVVVNVGGDPDGDWRALVARYPGATLAGASAVLGQWHYELPAPSAIWTTRETGPPVRIASVDASVMPEQTPAMLDGDLGTRWSTGRPQQGGEWLVVDLGAIRRVSGIDLLLGPSRSDAPARLTVDGSVDGQDWTFVWEGSQHVLRLLGALDDPSRQPVRAAFRPVDVRFLRLTQIGVEPAFYWSVAELAVLGPPPDAARPAR